jgi:hypothetical protein
MNTEFEQSESGECLRSCEPSVEQVCDEKPGLGWMTKGVPTTVNSPIRTRIKPKLEVEGSSRM